MIIITFIEIIVKLSSISFAHLIHPDRTLLLSLTVQSALPWNGQKKKWRA